MDHASFFSEATLIEIGVYALKCALEKFFKREVQTRLRDAGTLAQHKNI